MTSATVMTAPIVSRARITVSVQSLIAILLSLFAIDNLLLLQFLGIAPWIIALLIMPVCLGLTGLISHRPQIFTPVPISVLIISLSIAITLLLLGGEGRLFYANADWQIRDAILRDMATLPWPFAYSLDGQPYVLRAPIGMYLLPSLAGKFGLQDVALLLSNALRLAILLAVAWQLFESLYKRLFVLTVFFLFSGLDLVGTWIYGSAGLPLSWDHLETWNFGFQYSSHITQLFWVPQHAIAGWTPALMFLLWRKGLAPIGWFAATVPLVALWSPLSVMGTIPFVLLAGITVVIRRSFGSRDISIALVALAISIPALFYLQTDATKLGAGIRNAPAAVYIMIFALEVAPLIILPLLGPTHDKMERLTLWTILLCLLLMPFWIIGVNSDFQMRASIMPLALLAFAFAEWAIRTFEKQPRQKTGLLLAALIMTMGAVTPALELRRAIVNGPSPAPRCSLVGVWDKQTGLIAPYGTYLASAGSLPPELGTIPAIAGLQDPAQCWDRDWVPISTPE